MATSTTTIGGGIFNDGGGADVEQLHIVSGNSAVNATAAACRQQLRRLPGIATLTLTNSTFSGNSACSRWRHLSTALAFGGGATS